MTPDRARTELATLARELPHAGGSVRFEPAPPGLAELTGPILVLDHPEARGAMTASMMAGLAAAVVHAATEPWPVLWIRGTDGAFCSGGHLGQVRAGLGTADRGGRMADAMTAVLDALMTMPRLVVAEVDGPALGGGAEILTACDRVLCGPRARIGFVHGRLGVAPGWGGTARLVRRLGPCAALDVLVSAEVLDGAAAVDRGLAHACADDLQALVAREVAVLSSVAPQSIRAAKRQVLAASPWTRSNGELEAFVEVWGSAEHVRRLTGAPGRDR